MANRNSTPRVALYARVSTKNNGQDPETQLLALREYAENRKLTIFNEYVDTISGSKDSRPALNQMMTDAQRRRFDSVVVWKFDRFARSTRHLILSLEEFQSLGIDFISISESVDTSTPMGKMVYTVIAAVAELERSLIRERVVLGLRRAKSQGKQLGRPRTSIDLDKLRELHGAGLSHRQIAAQLGTSHASVGRALRNGTKTP